MRKNVHSKADKKISFGKFSIGIIQNSENKEYTSLDDPDIPWLNNGGTPSQDSSQKNHVCKIIIPTNPEELYDSDDDEYVSNKLKSIQEDRSLSHDKKFASSILLPNFVNGRNMHQSTRSHSIKNSNPDTKLTICLEKFQNGGKLSWPEKTDIHCWWCCHPFEGSPRPLPMRYDNKRKRFKVSGVFCSWSCARSYACDDNSVVSKNSVTHLFEFTKQIYGKSIDIPPAPPRQSLRIFGGDMSIEEFRGSDGEMVQINRSSFVLDPSVYFSRNF